MQKGRKIRVLGQPLDPDQGNGIGKSMRWYIESDQGVFFFNLPAFSSRCRCVRDPVERLPINELHPLLKVIRASCPVALGVLVRRHDWWGGCLMMQSVGSGVSSVEGR
jgi:hypothetical protein